MNIDSPSFKDGQPIPARYTCEGENINPELVFSQIPPEARSLVLIVDDPDIPGFVKDKLGIEVFDHWLIYNMPPTTGKISEKQAPPGSQGRNSSGANKYTGPCPPDGQHRYFFRLYALDTMLDLTEGSTRPQVENAMQGHIIAEAKFIGTYQKNHN